MKYIQLKHDTIEYWLYMLEIWNLTWIMLHKLTFVQISHRILLVGCCCTIWLLLYLAFINSLEEGLNLYLPLFACMSPSFDIFNRLLLSGAPRQAAFLTSDFFIDYHQNIRVELENLSEILLLLNKDNLVAIISFLLMIGKVRKCDVQNVTQRKQSDKTNLP